MSNTKKLFLDANILLEILFARSKIKEVSKVLHDPIYEFYTSVLTVDLLYYFAERDRIERSFVSEIAGLASHLTITGAMIELAQKRYNGKDFEDCLQAICAESNSCDEILTLDQKFKKDSATILPIKLIL